LAIGFKKFFVKVSIQCYRQSMPSGSGERVIIQVENKKIKNKNAPNEGR
jgi:hypothetical protein